nr:ABC-2 family transporter protein [Reinekea sp. G2M2-21]
MLGLLVQQLIILILLFTIFSGIDSLGGLTLNQVLFMIGLGQLVRGLDIAYNDYIWVEAFGGFSEGSLYQYLTRPMPIYLQILMNRVNTESVGPIAIGIALLAVSIHRLNVEFNVNDFLVLAYFIFTGAVILFSLKLIVASLSLWWGRSGELMQVIHEFVEFTRYPVSIYGWILQSVLLVFIPFGLVSFIPTLYWIESVPIPLFSVPAESRKLAILAYVTSISIIYFLLGSYVWRKGLQSTANTGT